MHKPVTVMTILQLDPAKFGSREEYTILLSKALKERGWRSIPQAESENVCDWGRIQLHSVSGFGTPVSGFGMQDSGCRIQRSSSGNREWGVGSREQRMANGK